jgi:dihydroflavonol-4-reductase
VDVDDVARGHILAMERGRSGERYLLGGDNVSHERLATELLPALTGEARSAGAIGPGLSEALARGMTAFAHLSAEPPLMTVGLVRGNLFRYSYIDSTKAMEELGYRFRPAVHALRRGLSWFAQHGYIKPRVAPRLREHLALTNPLETS